MIFGKSFIKLIKDKNCVRPIIYTGKQSKEFERLEL